MKITKKVLNAIHVWLTLIAVFVVTLPVYMVCYPIFFWKGELPKTVLKIRDKIADILYPNPMEVV